MYIIMIAITCCDRASVYIVYKCSSSYKYSSSYDFIQNNYKYTLVDINIILKYPLGSKYVEYRPTVGFLLREKYILFVRFKKNLLVILSKSKGIFFNLSNKRYFSGIKKPTVQIGALLYHICHLSTLQSKCTYVR